MTREDPATWLVRALIGPGLWAAGFAAVYGLHGLGCAQGWHLLHPGPGAPSLHWLAMAGAGGVTLLACGALLLWLPRGRGLPRRLPRCAGWIGLGATAFTLAPLLAASSC